MYENGKRKFKNLPELSARVQEVWDEIDISLLRKLVASMPNRCGDVIANKGRKIKY